MPVTSKDVQTVFCWLFCITRKPYKKKTTKQNHPHHYWLIKL